MNYSNTQLNALYVEVMTKASDVASPSAIYTMDTDGDVVMMDYTPGTKMTSDIGEPELPENFEDSLIEDEMLSTDELDNLLTELDSQYKNGANLYKSETSQEKYIVINDLHIPFQRKSVIEAIENTYGKKGYNLILNGDILDCYDISSFPKAVSVSLGNEIRVCKEYLRKWSKLFKNIYVVSGNHEGRLATYLRKRIAPEVVEFLPDDMLESVVKDVKLDNIKYVPGDTTNWFIQIDNVIICHPRSFSKANLGTAQKVQEFFTTRGFAADMFIVGHTHKLGKAISKGGVIIESGCLCVPQDYAMDGKVSYTPEASGFCVFTSRNNKVGFNDVRLHYVG